jgi:two-component system sensor histidine kinase DegS
MADTLRAMDGPGVGQRGEQAGRYDELKAESKEALASASNTLRSVRDRYRGMYVDELAHWEVLQDGLEARNGLDGPAQAAPKVRADVEQERGELGRREAELARLELAIRNLESTWLFLEQGDASLVTDVRLPRLSTELQMRILEAQEAERVRLAQEVHDGPAQALSNAIFQVEFIDSVFDTDAVMARTELRLLRDLLRRELADVRSFIVRLRPPVLVELGLDGSIRETVVTQAALGGVDITADLRAPATGLSDTAQTVALRVVQEALQNVRKHAGATTAVVATMLDDGQWVLEVRDDGRGFEPSEVATRSRRSFGLQFMRERAELVGARFEVRSAPGSGTVVRLAIPVTQEENG